MQAELQYDHLAEKSKKLLTAFETVRQQLSDSELRQHAELAAVLGEAKDKSTANVSLIESDGGEDVDEVNFLLCLQYVPTMSLNRQIKSGESFIDLSLTGTLPILRWIIILNVLYQLLDLICQLEAFLHAPLQENLYKNQFRHS